MEIRTKTTSSGTKYQFVNEYWETSRAWGHKTTIIRNGYDYDPYKMRYYNRTWESYTFQSCMDNAVCQLYDIELNRYIDDYKYNNKIDRFKTGEKQKVIDEFNSTDRGKDLQELKEAIINKEFDK